MAPIRKRRPAGVGTGPQEMDINSGRVINNGGLYGVNPPNSASASHDLKIPPSSLFSHSLQNVLLLGPSASVPQRHPANAPSKEYTCDAATSGGSGYSPEIPRAKGEPRASVDVVSEVLQTNAKCIDKSCAGEQLPSAVRGGDGGCKKVKDDGVGSAGCTKDAHMGRLSDLPLVHIGHSMIPAFNGQKVLPLELILSSGSRPARVSKSTKNKEVRLVSNNIFTQAKRSMSSMSKLKEEEEAEEKGHSCRRNKSLEAQALNRPASSKDPEFNTSLERYSKVKKKERNAYMRRDFALLISNLKGHRRARSVSRGQRSRMQVAAPVGHDTVWAVLGQSMPVATNEATATPSLEQKVEIKSKSVEKKKKKTIIKKKVAKIGINYMVAASTINEEKMRRTVKKETTTTSWDQQPQLVVELNNKPKKRKREVEAVVERCKRKDGREWQCREPVVKVGATYCEYHTLKMRENHARNSEKLAMGLSRSTGKRRRNSMDGAECGVEEDHDAEKGGEQVVQLLRRRWRKKCKPCIRRLHEIQERAKPADADQTEWEGEEDQEETSAPSTSSPETRQPPHTPLPECLLNTDPREWRSDLF